MPLHLHTMRSYCATAFLVIPAVALLGGAYSSPSNAPVRARVDGRATCGGHPLGGMWILFEEAGPGGHIVASLVGADGSFRMDPKRASGLSPGAYRVHFLPKQAGAPDPSLDPKYEDPRTSGLLVHVGPGWNEIMLTLPGPGQGPTVVRHRRGEGR
jgi:hypothetical protein